MTGFSVLTEQVQATAAEVARIEEAARGQVAQISDEVQALLSGGWVGGAASGFARGWQDWQAGAQEVLQALAAMSELLAETGRGYAAVEAANTQVVTGPASAL